MWSSTPLPVLWRSGNVGSGSPAVRCAFSTAGPSLCSPNKGGVAEAVPAVAHVLPPQQPVSIPHADSHTDLHTRSHTDLHNDLHTRSLIESCTRSHSGSQSAECPRSPLLHCSCCHWVCLWMFTHGHPSAAGVPLRSESLEQQQAVLPAGERAYVLKHMLATRDLAHWVHRQGLVRRGARAAGEGTRACAWP